MEKTNVKELAKELISGRRLNRQDDLSFLLSADLDELCEASDNIRKAKKICDMALIYDVGVQAHICASPLSTAAALHLESTIPNFVIHEHHRNSLYPHNRQLCTIDLQPKNGYLSVSDQPGWGCEFTHETMERKDSLTETIY